MTCFSEDYYEIVDIIRHFVYIKVQEFIDKYDREPKYIKVPVWVYLKLCDVDTYLVRRENSSKYKQVPIFLGLQVCETFTIDKIEEIEVF